MLLFSVALASCRELRTLYVGEGEDGDCFSSSCDFDTASLVVRNGDTVIFDEGKVTITNYPSAMSDLLHASMFMNITFVAKNDNTIFDGRFMAGDHLFNVQSASRFCWIKFVGFSFTNFEKPIFSREISETQWPLIIFKQCQFYENKADIFNVKGGTFQFDNCVFRDNAHRPIKAVTEAVLEFTDCVFERNEASFFFDCDLIINNCRFIDNFGSRGGALYLSKVTLTIDGAKFIRNKASNNGGAIYIRESSDDLDCEIKKSCFIDNEAGVNGSAIYSYWADTKLSGNCFSDKRDNALFAFMANGTMEANEYESKCEQLLRYNPEIKEFDPYNADPNQDIDVEVEPNSMIEL